MSYSLLIFLIFACSDIYLWRSYVKGDSKLNTTLYFIPLFLMTCSIIVSTTGFYQNEASRIFLMLMLCTEVPKFIFSVCSLSGRFLNFGSSKVATVFNWVGGISALIVCILFVNGAIWGWKHIVVREETMTFADLPQSFDEYRIVQLSDLHIGTYSSSVHTVQEIVDKTNALNPDLIVFTGDLVNGHPSELEAFMSILSQLKAKDGILSIMGNHDYCIYHHYEHEEDNNQAIANLCQKESQLGWNLIRNSHVWLHRGADSISVVGVEYEGDKPFLFPQKADLKGAMQGLSEPIFKILLSHDPSFWRKEVLPTTDIQLTLSGHTHAMQFKLFGFSPSVLSYKEWGGVYREGAQWLHVSMGIGSNVPLRFGAWPEIDVLTLKRDK